MKIKCVIVILILLHLVFTILVKRTMTVNVNINVHLHGAHSLHTFENHARDALFVWCGFFIPLCNKVMESGCLSVCLSVRLSHICLDR